MAPSGMVLGSRGARACDMCAKDRARWYCAADEAYLCERCDGAVHLANAVARRHERVRLGPNGAPLKLDRRSASRSSLCRAGDWTLQSKHGSKKKRPNQPQYIAPLPAPSGLVNPNPDPHISTPGVKIEVSEAALHATKQAPLKEQPCAAANPPAPLIIKDEPCSPISESQLTFYRELLDLTSDYENDPDHDVPAIEPLLCELIAASHVDLLQHDVVSTLPSMGESSSHESTISDIKVIKAEEPNLSLHDSELVDCTAMDEGSFSIDDTSSGIDTFDVMDLCANTGVEQDTLGSYDLVCNVLSDRKPCDQETSEEQAVHSIDLVIVPDVNGSQYTNDQSAFTFGYGARLEKSLSLRLNYEEIISAWSDRDSFWMDGQRPQIVPDCFLDAVTSADSSGLVNTEYSSCSSSSQAGYVPALSDAAREARVMRYKEKRRTRLFSKKIRYEVRKLNAERRPRMKGRFVKRSTIVDT